MDNVQKINVIIFLSWINHWNILRESCIFLSVLSVIHNHGLDQEIWPKEIDTFLQSGRDCYSEDEGKETEDERPQEQDTKPQL
jgi:hypothetical protein